MNTELWHTIAAGLLQSWVDKMISITNRDSRTLLCEHRAWHDWLEVQSWAALGYICTQDTIGLLWDEVDTATYDPQIREQDVPMVIEAASDGNSLTAEKAPVDHEIDVHQWNYTEFIRLGLLDTYSTPSPGIYILATRRVSDGVLSLPSLFLTIT